MDITLEAFRSPSEAERLIREEGLELLPYEVRDGDTSNLLTQPHAHRSAITAYVLDGLVRVYDAEGVLREAPAGARIFVPAGEMHQEIEGGYRALLGVNRKSRATGA
ncbi:MAG: hypothetical protein AB7L65_09070 [Hyphomonadaceae bacterium]